jgi:hypothetical protein
MSSRAEAEAGVNAPASPPYGKPSVAARVAAAALLFAVVEAAVFHSGFYASLAQPNSSAGRLHTTLYNERHREIDSPNQVLAVGDSRMSFVPKAAHEHTSGSGYAFATIMVAGSSPRCWYYMLREVDPGRNRYSAILIPIDDYDDDDWEDTATRAQDLHYLAPLLRLSDIVDFSSSFPTWRMRWEAVRGVLLRGWIFQRDFQALRSGPRKSSGCARSPPRPSTTTITATAA